MALGILITRSDGYTYQIHDAIIQGWSSHYGEQGGGFGYLRFSLPRKIGYDYPDLRYGYGITVFKYVGLVVFDGMIREVNERSSRDGDEIQVTALGWPIVAEDDELNQHYCDSRLNLWTPIYGEIPRGDFRPDLYTMGSDALGFFIHCNNGATYGAGDYLWVKYEFNEEADSAMLNVYEQGKRIKMTLDAVMGNGVAFDGDIVYPVFYAKIDTVDDGTDTVVYKDDVGEDTVINGDTLRNATRDATATISTVTQGTNTIVLSGSPDLSTWAPDDQLEIVEGRFQYGNTNNDAWLAAGMTISNLTRNQEAEISSVDTANDRIVVTDRDAISSWEAADEIFMPGPIFWAQINNISGADITYDTETGETNLATNWPIVNITKKAMAQVQSVNTGTNVITVTDSNDLFGWETDDAIIQPVMYFYATMNGNISGQTVTYQNEIGLRLVQNDTGWVVYNETQDDFATIVSWNTASNQFNVGVGQGSGWSGSDILRIYTPFYFYVTDGGGNYLWPTPSSNWMEGAIMQQGIEIDATDAGTNEFHVNLQNYIAGTANESTFVRLRSLRVYNTQSDVTPNFLGVQMKDLLQGYTTGHGVSNDEWDIDSTLTNVIEPAVFEYVTPKEALAWMCGFGDGAADPARTAWGIRLNDKRRFYLELQDLSSVDYVIVRGGDTEVQSGGDIGQSAQRVQGVYTDALGDEQYTDWHEDSDAYFDGLWRRHRVRLDSVDNDADADIAIALYLKENSSEKRAASYRVSNGSIFNVGWLHIPFDEVMATGRLAKIQDARVDSSSRLNTSDARDSWTVEQIVAVEVDYQGQSVHMIPASAKSSFEAYMAVLARMALR